MATDHIALCADISNKIIIHMSAMIDMEQKKRDALLQYDIQQTERLMNNQQAMVMQLDIMEKKRLKIQADAGFATMTSSELLNAVSPEEKQLLEPIFLQLQFTAQELQSLNKISLEIATTELRLMGQAPVPSATGLYRANGKKQNSALGGTSFTETF